MSDFSSPVAESAYGCPAKSRLSASPCTRSSGESLRCRTPDSTCARMNSTSAEASVGLIRRSARIAHVLSKVSRVPRKPNIVQSSRGSTTIALPSAAIFAVSALRV